MAILCLWAVFGPPVTAAQAPSKEDLGRYIVVLKDSVEHPGERARAQTEQRDGELGFVYRHAFNGYSAELPKGAVEALRKNPSVLSVEPDGRGGVASQDIPTGIDRIFATNNAALDIDEEDDQRVDVDVAVLDTGIDAGHPDLDVVSQVDCSASFPCEAGGADGNSHGTHVAGTIAAIDNGEGVVGVAPGARLWSVKVLDNKGFGNLSEFIAGIDWVTAHASEIEVANSSLRYGCCTSSEAFNKAIKGSLDAGVVHVVAAGNEAETVQYIPGNHPDVITVSALSDTDGLPEAEGVKDQLAAFSNFGSVVDVAAPGVSILSTLPGNSYGSYSGTSMASPHVSGAAALLASVANPESREDVEGIRDQIVERGNFDWIDTSEDGEHEPLLDLSEPLAFPFAPSVTTKAATNVKAKEATLNATVNPGGTATTYQFEYGTTTSYGTKIPLSPKSIGSGTSGVPVSETPSGLSANTTYHYRVAATNEVGTTYGADKTLTTPKAPTATTQAATNVKANGARLKATVNPGGTATTYQFEYGTTTSYGTKIPLSPKLIGSGTSNLAVSGTASGLSANTTYHYRVAATNEVGTTYGADKTLTTAMSSIAFTGAFGSEGSGEGEFAGPWGIAIDSSDNVLVADTGNNRIQVLDAEGEYVGQFTVPTPVDLAIDSNGDIWVADAESHCIRKLSASGKYLGQFGSYGTGNGQFSSYPAAIAIDSSDHVWVADNGNHRVQEFNAAGEYLGQFGSYGSGNGQFSYPTAIAIDANEHIWVADESGRIQEFNAEGEYLSQFGSEGSGNGEFYYPAGIAVDSNDHVWVVDTSNHRVQEFNTEGEYLSQFGSEGSGNGQFSYPTGIAVDSNEHILVADTGNHRIQRWIEGGPTATTEAATNVKAKEATLKATINPGGTATTYQFEYGTTTSYGTKIPLSPKSIGSGTSGVPVSETVSGLSANTTYHYRVAATNEVGTTYGADKTLTTAMSSIAFTGAFGSEGSGEGEFAGPWGIAIDSSDNVLVADTGNNRIQVLDAEGEYVGQFTVPTPVDLAIDSNGDIWVADAESHCIRKLSASGKYLGQFGSYGTGNGQFSSYPAAIAIDSSDHVWVADNGNHRVQEFNAAGEYLGQFGSYGSGNGQFSYPTAIAIDANEHIWVADESGRIQEFNAEGEYLSQFGSEGSGNGEFYYPAGIAVDSNDHVWVVDTSNHRVQEFNTEGEYLSQFGSEGSGNGQFSYPTGIAVDSNEHILVADTGNHRIQRWIEGGPTATTEAATNVKAKEATLKATINPGGTATTYQFEYGTTTSYGTKIPLSPKSIGSGTSGVPVSETVSGLSANTTYHYRVAATNEVGTTYGADKTLTTPKAPTATTEAATNVKAKEATLNATINPGGLATTYQFEYGTTTSYGTKIPLSAKSIGSGTSGVPVSETVSGLSANTTYHYRVVVTNEAGTTYGADKTLKTALSGVAFVGAVGSEGSGNGEFYNPAGIAVDSSDNVLVADTYNNRIQVFNAEGEYLSKFGGGTLTTPADVAVDSNGDFLVADTGNNRIKRFYPNGEYLSQFGSLGSGNGQFIQPMSIAINSNSGILVADQSNRIQKFNAAGEYLSQFGSKGSGNGQFDYPMGIAIDANDHIWVADYGNHRIQKFNAAGEYLSQFGSYGSGNGQFSFPQDIAIDASNHIWVSDRENSRVQEFNAAGEYLSQFGSEGSGEGQFYGPAGIAVDANEQIWVADNENNRIQRWGSTP